jgi:NAD(P)H-hydrate epimerase
VTVTIGFPKIGLYFHPGKEYVGRLIIQDIGYPDEIVAQKKVIVSFPTFKHMEKLLPARHAGGSKYDHGLALLVCGSRGYTGSAALACEAALRTGCGMAHLAIPESIVPVLSIKLTETVLHSLKETKNGTLDVSAVDQVKNLVNGKNALCIGPGLTHEDQVALFVKEIIRTVKLPVILDADGINVFKGCAEELMDHAGEMVITPHRGEWFRLFGELPSEPVAIIDTLRNVAFQYNLTILLKGSPSIVVTSKGIAYILPFGNSSLAKAGTGDVLSGIIVSLLAQGMSVENAAVLGCFIHGEAGVAASELLSEYSVVATDVVNNIYKVMKRLWGRDPI